MANPAHFPNPQVSLLHHHAYYLSELCYTDQLLQRHSAELYDVESTLAHKTESGLDRRQKKRLQWSRALYRKSISQLQLRRMWLSECLQRCLALQSFYARTQWPMTREQLPHIHRTHGRYPGCHFNPAICLLDPQQPSSMPAHGWRASSFSGSGTYSPFSPSADSGYGPSFGYSEYESRDGTGHSRPLDIRETANTQLGSTDTGSMVEDTPGLGPSEEQSLPASASHRSSEVAAEPSNLGPIQHSDSVVQLVERIPSAGDTSRKRHSMYEIRTGSDGRLAAADAQPSPSSTVHI